MKLRFPFYYSVILQSYFDPEKVVAPPFGLRHLIEMIPVCLVSGAVGGLLMDVAIVLLSDTPPLMLQGLHIWLQKMLHAIQF